MTKKKLREKAIKLRVEEGLSYSEIKRRLEIPKSTLSYWLREYPLSEEKIEKLQKKGRKRGLQTIERFRNTMQKKRKKRLEKLYKKEKKRILPFNKRDLFIAGLFLYIGEGTKTKRYSIVITNSDPAVIKLFIYWLKKIFKVPKDQIKISLHLYNDMKKEKEINFWKKKLNLPLKQFNKPYIKKSSRKKINYKGRFNHGTCKAKISGKEITEKIKMQIKVIQRKFN